MATYVVLHNVRLYLGEAGCNKIAQVVAGNLVSEDGEVPEDKGKDSLESHNYIVQGEELSHSVGYACECSKVFRIEKDAKLHFYENYFAGKNDKNTTKDAENSLAIGHSKIDDQDEIRFAMMAINCLSPMDKKIMIATCENPGFEQIKQEWMTFMGINLEAGVAYVKYYCRCNSDLPLYRSLYTEEFLEAVDVVWRGFLKLKKFTPVEANPSNLATMQTMKTTSPCDYSWSNNVPPPIKTVDVVHQTDQGVRTVEDETGSYMGKSLPDSMDPLPSRIGVFNEKETEKVIMKCAIDDMGNDDNGAHKSNHHVTTSKPKASRVRTRMPKILLPTKSNDKA